MLTELRDIEDLLKQNAWQVKNQWNDLIHLVHEEGSVAITSHANVEMVLVDARVYRKLTKMAHMINARNQATLDDLNARFEASLKTLREPGGRRLVEELFAADGKLTGERPIAGSSF